MAETFTREASGATSIHPGDIVVVDAGVFNASDGEVIAVDPDTGFQALVSSNGLLVDPTGVAIGRDGSILVADPVANMVIQVDSDTGDQRIFASGGRIARPVGIDVDANGDVIVTNSSSDSVVRIDRVTRVQTTLSHNGHLEAPVGVAVGPGGAIVVADNVSGVVRIDPLSGEQVLITPDGISIDAAGIAIDASGMFLVSDFVLGGPQKGHVVMVDPVTGQVSPVSSADRLINPLGLEIDLDGRLLVADPGDLTPNGAGTESILAIEPTTGDQTLISTGGRFVHPLDLTVFPATVGIVAPANAARGERIDVDIMVGHGDSVAGIQFDMRYEAKRLRLLSLSAADPESGCLSAEAERPGVVIFAMACSNGVPVSQPLWTAQFLVVDIIGPTDLRVDNLLLNDFQVLPNVVPSLGGVTTVLVEGGICGDLDENGEINLLDMLALLQIVVGLFAPNHAQEIAGDLNRSGHLDIADAIIGLQNLVGVTDVLVCRSG